MSLQQFDKRINAHNNRCKQLFESKQAKFELDTIPSPPTPLSSNPTIDDIDTYIITTTSFVSELESLTTTQMEKVNTLIQFFNLQIIVRKEQVALIYI